MSQIHILNTLSNDEGVRCGRKATRGKINEVDYRRLLAGEAIRPTEKVKISHYCAYRKDGRCYQRAGVGEVNCPRRSRTVSAICRDCVRRTRS